MKVYDNQFKPRQKPNNFHAESTHGTVKLSTDSGLQVDASCKVNTDFPGQIRPGNNYTNPRLAPWKLGFMQVRVVETCWAYYRGVEPNHGCVLRDMSPGPGEEVWRDFDHATGDVFFEGARSAR